MENGYVGRFGDTLRKLTALDAQRGAFAPQQIGGADTAGAFSVAAPSPQAAPAPGMGAMAPEAAAAPPDATGGFSGGSAVPPEVDAQPAGAMDESGAAGGGKPTSWDDLHKQMTPAHKNIIADKIEQAVGSLKNVYRRVAQQNGVTPKPHASRAHMAMFLAEIALRTAANRGTSDSDGQALAKGVLQTQERRGALAESDRQRQEVIDERKRQEARDDQIRQQGYTHEDTTHARNRGEEVSDTKDKYAHDIELENIRARAQALREKGQDTYVAIDGDGNYTLIDKKTGAAIPVTQEVPVKKGSRGKGTTTTTEKKPVKALPKPNASGLDDDTILNKIAAATKELRGNGKLVRGLKTKFGNDQQKVDAEIQRMAREQVQKDVEALRNPNAANAPADGAPAAGKVVDFNDLK